MAAPEILALDAFPAFHAEDLPLWNWQNAFLPGAAQWQEWLSAVAAQLLRHPQIATAKITRTNASDAAEAAWSIAVETAPLRIGRDPENEIVLPQLTVTRQHAELRSEGGSLWLMDLGSSLGTFVDGAKLPANQRIELVNGAEFVIFPYRFQVELVREWVPAHGTTIVECGQAIRSAAEYATDCAAGWRTFSVGMQHTPENFCISIETTFLHLLTEKMLAPLGPAEFALASSENVWGELLVLGALAQANHALAAPFHLTLAGGQKTASEKSRGIEYRALLELAGRRGAVRCFVPFAMLNAVRRQWKGDAPASLNRQAPVRFQVSWGRIELSLRERRALEPGDVILYSHEPALLFPGDDARGWSGESATATRVILQEHFDRSMSMAEAKPEPLTDFADLNITVEILVGRKEMTLREAETLAPGSVVDLERDPRDAVRLAVNGHVIGTGELVAVDGRLGVKIIDWLTPDGLRGDVLRGEA